MEGNVAFFQPTFAQLATHNSNNNRIAVTVTFFVVFIPVRPSAQLLIRGNQLILRTTL